MENLSLAASDIDRIDDLPRAFTYRRQRAREAADALSAPEPAPVSLLDVPMGRLSICMRSAFVAQTTTTSRSAMPSTWPLILSPFFSDPTPAGVPVKIRSPAFNSKRPDRKWI